MFASSIDRVAKPEIWQKKTNHECVNECNNSAAEYHCRGQPQDCRNREPHAQEDVGMMRLAIPGEQQTTDNFRVGLTREKAPESGEWLCHQVRTNRGSPRSPNCARAAGLPSHLFQESALRRRAAHQKDEAQHECGE